MSQLPALFFQKYRFSLEVTSPMLLPPYKGSTFRGGVLTAFKEAVCLMPHGQCETCPLTAHCSYYMLFEPQPLTSSPGVPMPYVIEPPLTERRMFDDGDTMEFSVILIGKATLYWNLLIFAVKRLGQTSGIGRRVDGRRGRFQVVRVDSVDPNGHDVAVYSAEGEFGHDQPITLTEEEVGVWEGSKLSHPGYRQNKPTVIENITCYLLPIHLKAHDEIDIQGIVPDIDDEASNDQFQDLIYGLCALLERKGYSIHISLAGGRKTMSAYQMTASTLFPVDKELSHVLEPTMTQLEEFITQHCPDLARGNKDQMLNQVQAAYQPFPGLYVGVPVEYISLAKVSSAIANRLPGFAEGLEPLIVPLNQLPLNDIFLDPNYRKRIYKIGKVYRKYLGRIDAGIARKIEQGIAGGMLHSFLKHEVKGQVFKEIRGNLDDILQDAEGSTNVKNGAREILTQIDLLEKTLFAIQAVTDLDPGELKKEVESVGQHETKTIKEIIDLSREMYRVNDHLRAHFLKIQPTGEFTVTISCHPTLLALAFNNIIRNFMKEIRRERCRPEGERTTNPPYQMTIPVRVEGDRIIIRFEDNGPGFPPELDTPEKLERLFQMDFSTHHDDGESQGLGLPIVRKIIRAHGEGKIHAERNQPNGAVFEINLPAR